MQKLTRADIKAPAEYAPERDAFRRAIIALKAKRRVHLGDRVTLVFENRDTMRFQIQEMCRIERIGDDAGIQAEVDVYNELIPDANELSASLFIEVPEEDQIKPILDSFIGLDRGERLRFEFDCERVPAQFEEGHSEEDRIAAVHYVRFAFTPEQRAAFERAAHVALVLDHPGYERRTELAPETLAELRADLSDRRA